MGWAEALPSGRYRAVYRDAAGVRRSAGTYTHKPLAVRKANAAEEKARRRMTNDPDAYKRPWGEWCAEWWEARIVEDSTIATDRSRRDKYLMPKWEKTPIGSIRRHDVKVWAGWLLKQGLSPSTVQRVVHLFSASMAAAVDAELVEMNPAARLRLPAGEQDVERYLTRKEFGLILGQLPTVRDQLIAELLVFTGLRFGELAGLHVNRVDLELGMVRVVETYVDSAHLIKPYPKGRRKRDVPLTADLVVKLRPLVVAAEDFAAVGEGCGVPHKVGRCRSALLLTGARGGVLRDSNWASRVWVPAVEESGVGHVRIHDLRHTYASWLLQGGKSLAEVGQLMGHVSPATTQKYAHLQPVDRGDVVARLGGPVKPRTVKKAAKKAKERMARRGARGGLGAPRLPHAG